MLHESSPSADELIALRLPNEVLPGSGWLENGEALRRSDEVLPNAEHQESIPTPLSRYRILQQLSAGEDGTAFKAIELSSGTIFNLRRIAPGLSKPDRRLEIHSRLKLVGLLDHPTSLRIHDASLECDPPFVVLESPAGRTLAEALEVEGALPAATILSLAAQITDSIVAAHRLGLIHGQLNPQSIWLSEHRQAKIDFTGLQTDHSINTPANKAYAPPEVQAGNQGDEAADFYCLGRLLSFLLGGQLVSEQFRSHSPRQTAGLKQLLSRTQEADPANRPLATEILSCLRELAKEEFPAIEEVVQRKLEADTDATDISQDHSANDSTSEVVVQVDQNLDRTDELSSLDEAATAESKIEVRGTRPGEDEAADETDATQHEQAPSILSGVPKPHRHLVPGDRLGRYVIARKLGEGGMGSVFQATDITDGRVVAIKVLSATAALKSTALRRFQKEARLLAAVNSPYVTNLIAVSEEEGRHYIVLEFVDGTDLKKVLSRLAPLPEQQALSIAADVARALVDAHQRGIVHRDIKPENVLLTGDVTLTSDKSAGLTEPFQVKLSDFGIARHVDQSESLAMTQAGAVIGTPLYMSPEQCKGQADIAPQSDVYSLGITMFEMLVGSPPFQTSDPMQLAAMHCFETPPLVSKLNPRVSEAVAAIVAKALAKQSTERYADAAHLLRAIDERLRGVPADITIHPLLPEHDRDKLAITNLSWDLASSPEELWPYVSNTERLNRALGLPPVTYRTEIDPEKGIRKFGSFKLGGVAISWEEHPFEWVEGRRMGILREFDKGPFQWFLSTVELERLPSGGTRLHHNVKIAPRNLLGKVLAKIEADMKARRSLTKVYTRIDQTLSGQLGKRSFTDPFEQPVKLTGTRRKRLEERLTKLIDRGVDPEIASKLGEFIATGPAQEIAKIRPIALADRFQIDQQVMLDACLLATSEGVLTLQWDILCPVCRVAADARSTLKELQSHTFCEACNADFASDVANSIEMVFKAQADLRDTNVGKYCIGGPEHSPHVVAQLRIASAEHIEVELTLPVGEYLLRGPQLSKALTLNVQSSGAPSHCEINLSPQTDHRRSPTLRAGQQILSLTNEYPQLQLVRLERTISRHDVITAAHASTVPLFRELFPQQVFDTSQLVSTEQVTLLATSVGNIDSIYSRLGDAEAYRIIQNHLKLIEEAIRRGRGAVVKVVGEGVLAVFDEPTDAVSTALQIPKLINESETTSMLRVGIGVHRGSALVTTVNDRLDYFGAAARIAAALPSMARDQVLLSEAVFSDPLVTELLHEQNLQGEIKEFNLPGSTGQLVQSFSVM